MDDGRVGSAVVHENRICRESVNRVEIVQFLSSLVEVREVDALVIGGGVAGSTAALSLQRNGLRVMLIAKGLIGRTGATIFGGGLWLPQFDPSRYSDSDRAKWLSGYVKRMHSYLIDQDYVAAVGEYANSSLLSNWEKGGLYIRRNEDGSLLSSLSKGYITWAHKDGFSGVSVGALLRKELVEGEVEVREETMATSLLTLGGEVVGAAVLDYARGEFFAVSAKSTLLATGHSGFLSLRSTATRELCANGMAMAFRAGAELSNLEMQWFHVSDMAKPDSWMRVHVFPFSKPGSAEQARLVNSKGEAFFDPAKLSSDPTYYAQLKSLAPQVKKGNASWNGEYYTSYTHMPSSLSKDYSYQEQFYEKIGIDARNSMIETGITWHISMGGVSVDTKTMASTVPGLYAAGAAGGHNISSLVFASYDGALAARSMSERCSKIARPRLDHSQVENEEKRILGFLDLAGVGTLPSHVKGAIRRTMWDRVGYVKSETSLREALESLARIRRELVPKMRVPSKTSSYNLQLVDAIDVYDMLDVCELIINSCLIRRESRGPFYREEFPYVDNENWLKVIGVRRGSDGQLLTEIRPVDPKYIKPKKPREDYFEADY